MKKMLTMTSSIQGEINRAMRKLVAMMINVWYLQQGALIYLPKWQSSMERPKGTIAVKNIFLQLIFQNSS